MLIYNTLTKKKEEFKPLNPPYVTFYMCGPTVYDYFHIGNGRSFIVSDIIRRYLIYKGYNVKFVMNLTDIDDKIINKANNENVDPKVITDKYISAFFEDINKMKIRKADVYPKATEHINEIISLIQKLEREGIAYNVNGDVFFDVGKFTAYGKLSGKKLDELESGSRVEIDERKSNPLDFALWKKAKEGEPCWDSPWSKGRPGWHIECSAMSCAHLGETIDIHAGGNDLIFPHHENEIAQSEAANHKAFVKYWLHFGFLNIKDEKMSKSSGNFFTAREIVKKYPPEAIRLFFSQTHYRGPLSYSDELLEAAAKGLEKISNLYEELLNRISNNEIGGYKPEFQITSYVQKFEESMDDDFNSPKALAVIFDFIRDMNKELSIHEKLSAEFLNDGKEFFDKIIDGVFGILPDRKNNSSNELTEKLIYILIELRSKAKAERNYSLSDDIRDKLTELGITLKDSKSGTTFKIN